MMAVSSLKIKAYFDYDKDNIYVTTKYLKNDVEIPYSSISNFHEISQIKHYKNVLEGYGFFENILADGTKVWDFLNTSLEPLRNVAELYFSKNLDTRKLSSFASPKIMIKKECFMLDVFVD